MVSNSERYPREYHHITYKFFVCCFPGDVEVLLELPTYAHSAICTQKTEVFILEMKHFDRLLAKRNPRTVDNMKEGLKLKLKARTSKFLEKNVPLMKQLYFKTEESIERKEMQMNAKTEGKQPRKKNKINTANFDQFLPPRGPVIDIHGPGTVFHRIRQREAARIRREEKRMKVFGDKKATVRGSGGLKPLVRAPPPPIPDGPRVSIVLGMPNVAPTAEVAEPASPTRKEGTDDAVLSNLEERMRAWLSNDGSGRARKGLATSQGLSQSQVGNGVRYRWGSERKT